MNEKKVAARLASEQMRFLEVCAGLELKVARLYHHFEHLFADDLQFSSLWKKTAREEENHAQQFQLGIRLKGIGMMAVNADVSQVISYFEKAEAHVEKCLAARPSQEGALKLAINLEEKLAAFHMSSIVVFEDSELKKMFDAMMQSDEGHISMLKNCLDSMSGGNGDGC